MRPRATARRVAGSAPRVHAPGRQAGQTLREATALRRKFGAVRGYTGGRLVGSVPPDIPAGLRAHRFEDRNSPATASPLARSITNNRLTRLCRTWTAGHASRTVV